MSAAEVPSAPPATLDATFFDVGLGVLRAGRAFGVTGAAVFGFLSTCLVSARLTTTGFLAVDCSGGVGGGVTSCFAAEAPFATGLGVAVPRVRAVAGFCGATMVFAGLVGALVGVGVVTTLRRGILVSVGGVAVWRTAFFRTTGGGGEDGLFVFSPSGFLVAGTAGFATTRAAGAALTSLGGDFAGFAGPAAAALRGLSASKREGSLGFSSFIAANLRRAAALAACA